MEKKYEFLDVRFMTAREKLLVLRNWKRFLKYGLKIEHFTKRLYNHLHLHCGFIAHYNLNGYYSTYFETGQDTKRFFENFCNNVSSYGSSDFNDLNTAMLEVYRSFNAAIFLKADDDIKDHLDLLEACLVRAKQDNDFAEEFLTKLKI